MIGMVLTAVFGGVLIGAGISDAMTFRIPNTLPLILVGVFALNAITSSMPYADVLWHVAAGAIVLAAGTALFAWNKIGGGDVKLAAAVALWVGTSWLMALLFLISLVGLVLALAVIVLRLYGFAAKASLPYGVAIAGGWLLLFLVD